MSGGITITVGGVAVPVYEPGKVTIDDRTNARSTATFTVVSSVAQSIAERQAVTIESAIRGILFTGSVDKIETQKLQPSSTSLYSVTCVDDTDLMTRRAYRGPEMSGVNAGDVVSLVHSAVLRDEGIEAYYALDRDDSATDWQEGGHNGTAENAGACELAPAGIPFVVHETSTADWNAYTTLYNIDTANDQLTLASMQAIKWQGTAVEDVSNLCAYRKVWAGTSTIASGDFLQYDVWISSTSPKIMAGIDLMLSDNTRLKDKGLVDQTNHKADPTQSDLTGFADDLWYTRYIYFPAALVGKSIKACMVGLGGQEPGAYTAYFRNVKHCASDFSTKTAFFSPAATALQSNMKGAVTGYADLSCTVVKAYERFGYRISASHQNTTCQIAKQSIVAWTSTVPDQTQGRRSDYFPQVRVQTSFDGGATWQTCTNHAGVPLVEAGLSILNTYFYFYQLLSVGGPNPELSPVLSDCQLTILPAAAATKSDVTHTDLAPGDFGDGTLTNLAVTADGLAIMRQFRDFNGGDVSSMTVYGTGTYNTYAIFQYLDIEGDTGLEVRWKLTWAGNWNNFVAECDVRLTHTLDRIGFCYRTTYWGNGNNTFGWLADISTADLRLGYGSNSSSGSFTSVQTVALTLETWKWYSLRVVANGSSHKVYLDDVLYIDITDTTYQATSGGFGLRYTNGSGVYSWGHFDNFGVMDTSMSGQRTAPSVSLTSAAKVLSSRIWWREVIPDGTSLLVESSVNAGSTWSTCTNGGAIPGLPKDTDVSAMNLLIRQTLTTQSGNDTPRLQGMTWRVVGAYSSTGTRTSAPLVLDAVGRAGSSSLAWAAETPAGTTLSAETSTNGGAWTAIVNGDPITALSVPASQSDDFEADHRADYTSTSQAGGVPATVTWDTANSRLLLSGGTNALYVWNALSASDSTIEAVVRESDTGALLARYTSPANQYRVYIYDSLSSVSASRQTLAVVRRSGGSNTWLTSLIAIDFIRGVAHALKVTLVGQQITVFWDGQQVYQTTDAGGLSASGTSGFYHAGTGEDAWHSLRLQPLGADLSVGGTVSPQVSGVAIFPANNVWNQPCDRLPVHASSDDWIAALLAHPPATFRMKIGSTSVGWQQPINTVTNATPTMTPSILYAVTSYAGPYPIPVSPLIEEPYITGSDRHMICLNTDTHVCYEVWDLRALGYQTAVLADSPRLYCRLGQYGASTGTDSSGNSLDLTPSGSVSLPDLPSAMNVGDGNAGAWFPATLPYGYLSRASFSLGVGVTAVTMEVWAMAYDWGGSGTLIEQSPADGAYSLKLESGVLKLRGASSVAVSYTVSGWAAASWHHLMVTITGTTGTIYADGASVATGTIAAITNTTNTLSIGRSGDGTNYFLGRMSDLGIYPSALLLARVTAHRDAALTMTGPYSIGSGWNWDVASNALPYDEATAADGASAPMVAGLVRRDEVNAGAICHALRGLVYTTNGKTWPAVHTGSSSIGYAPMGSRMRLKANVDISGYSRDNRVILEALKRYGFILCDNGSVWLEGYGVPDDAWDDDDIQTGLNNTLSISDFEFVDSSSLMISSSSGQTPYAPQQVRSRFTLTSTDPTLSSRVVSATLSVRDPSLQSGSLIPSTGVHGKKADAIISNMATRSNYVCGLERGTRHLYFRERDQVLAAWPLDSADPLFLYAASPILRRSSPKYRNRQIVTNAYDVETIQESKQGNGIVQSWALSGQVQSVNWITVNGQAVTVATDDQSGYDFYYRVSGVTLAQEKSDTPLTADETVTINYVARVPYEAMDQDTTQQAILAAAYPGTSGIVEDVEDGAGCDKTAADAIAQARIDQYARLTRDFTYSTRRSGLVPGVTQSLFVPEYSLTDVDMLVCGVRTTIAMKSSDSVIEFFDVTASEGPPLGGWSRLFLAQTGGG